MQDCLRALPVRLDESRAGLTVEELIAKLQAIEDKSRRVAVFGFDSVTGVHSIEEQTAAGYAGSYGFQATPIVLLLWQ